MDIQLRKANINDCAQIHSMQISSFADLLNRYQDYDMSPGAETVDRVMKRMGQDCTDYYCILLRDSVIGAIRVERLPGEVCRIAPLFILPEYQRRGYAKQVLKAVEGLYPKSKCWKLDTIKQERKLCHLYESMGYSLTGQEELIKEGMSIVYYQKIW